MSIFTDILDVALPLILSTANKIADGMVKGEELNKDQKQALYAAYVIIKVYGDDLVNATSNPYDDQALAELADFAADTLSEAGVELPSIPSDIATESF